MSARISPQTLELIGNRPKAKQCHPRAVGSSNSSEIYHFFIAQSMTLPARSSPSLSPIQIVANGHRQIRCPRASKRRFGNPWKVSTAKRCKISRFPRIDFAGKTIATLILKHCATTADRDGITQDSNWYISKHPRCNNLFIATAGSFHGVCIFLPIISSCSPGNNY